MTRRPLRRRLAPLLALLAGAAALCWWAIDAGPRGRGSHAPGPEASAATARSDLEPAPRPDPEPASDLRSAVESGGRLLATVVVAGRPVRGRAVWATADAPLLLDRLLTPMTPDLGAGDDLGRAAFDGTFTIDVPGGRWTTLRVRDAARGTRVRRVRVPPFTGEQRLEIALDDESPRLRIQAWRSDLSGPLGNAEVVVRWDPLGRAGPSQEHRLRTDPTGQALLEGLDPGALLVRTAAARESDPWPACVRVVATTDPGLGEILCAVVEPPPLRDLDLRVRLDPQLARSDAKLFLRRVDGAGDLHPQPGVLADAAEFVVRVPDGIYELGVLPLGVATADPTTVAVDGDMQLPVHVRRAAERTELTLVGIPDRHLPVRVAPQSPDDLAGMDPSVLFVGPGRWTLPTAAVGAWPAGASALAVARQATFLSEHPVDSRHGGSVRMREASLLHVEWLDGPLVARAPVVLEVRAGGSSFARTMSACLTQHDRVMRPAHVARVAVPSGAIELAIFDGEGRTMWQQTIEAQRPQQRVQVATR